MKIQFEFVGGVSKLCLGGGTGVGLESSSLDRMDRSEQIDRGEPEAEPVASIPFEAVELSDEFPGGKGS